MPLLTSDSILAIEIFFFFFSFLKNPGNKWCKQYFQLFAYQYCLIIGPLSFTFENIQETDLLASEV